MFSFGKGAIAQQTINLDTDDLRVILLDNTYAFDDNDQFLADVLAGGAAGAEISRSAAALANTSVSTTGVFDADDQVHAAVTLGDTVANCIIFKHTGSDATARLLSFHEGVDVVTNGQDITIVWPNGATKIFKL